MVLVRLAPGEQFPEVTELHEVRTMLAETVDEWTREWREEGRKEGEIQMLVRQLERKFGPLAEHHRQRLEKADAETLLEWGDRVLAADNIDDVLKD